MPRSKTLRVSDLAKKDLVRIGDYTRRRWGVAQKRKYLGQLMAGFKAIRDTSGLGAPRDDIASGLRGHPTDKHVIFYRETESELLIVRVLHESMDLRRHLT